MIFRRHTSHCKLRRAGRRGWQCGCPIWIDVRRSNGRRVLASMGGLTNWQEAQTAAEKWEQNGERPQPQPTPPGEKQTEITLEQAWDSFIARTKTRNLKPASIYKYELLSRQMKTFAGKHGVRSLRDLTLDLLEQFQNEWKEGPLSRAKKLERLKAFFRAAQIRRWIDDDPASALQAPIVWPRPTLPFTRDEVERILDATRRYPDKTGKLGSPSAARLRAFVLLLRFSGLRIGDAVSLRKEMVHGHQLLLYTSKTGSPVFCVLPEFVAEALRSIIPLSDRYFFWTGNSTLHTAKGIWQRSLQNLFEMAGIQNGFCHRFRDTFSVELLQAGVPIEEVAVLLGHSSSKITSRHYAPWVRSRQEQLAKDLQRAWKQDPLVLLEEEAARKMRVENPRVN
jgi:integrase/recombinase XerD